MSYGSRFETVSQLGARVETKDKSAGSYAPPRTPTDFGPSLVTTIKKASRLIGDC